MTYDLQALSDQLAIRDLSARYNRFADHADGAGYAGCFTEDGEFDLVGHRVYRGREEIATAVMPGEVTVHITTDPLIELDGDTARQTSRTISCRRDPSGKINHFVATGWYTDELRRTEDGWKFHRRRCELDLDLVEVYQRMSADVAAG